MAQVLGFLLILAHTSLILAASASETDNDASLLAFRISNEPKEQAAEPPVIRKLGKHHWSPSEAPSVNGRAMSSSDNEEGSNENMYLEKQHHHSSVDKSVAGGGVILGGLVTAFVVSIFCYIRATRRRSTMEPPTPSVASSV